MQALEQRQALGAGKVRQHVHTEDAVEDADVDPVWDPFCEVCREPTFEKQVRITAGGNPPTADCGYKPRSATSTAEGSKSLPTMWTDQPWPEFCDEPCDVSAMPPVRPVRLFPAPALPLLALPFPAPLFPQVGFPRLGMASETAIAMEYASSPVAQPALQMRSGLDPSLALRA